MTLNSFRGLGFVATTANADPAVIQPLGVVSGLAAQLAFGLDPRPDADLRLLFQRCTQRGLDMAGWCWCAASTVAGAKKEAVFHAERCADFGLSLYVANAEEPYDAHGNSASSRYGMLSAYVDAFQARVQMLGLAMRAVGFTSTPGFGSEQTQAAAAGWACMPQAFSLAEPSATVAACVAHSQAWGWPIEQIRPLVQVYSTDGAYPPAGPYLSDSEAFQVGVVPYVVEQALDSEGRALLTQLKPATFRAFKEADVVSTVIGSNDGIKAAVNRLRDLDPAGTKLVKVDGSWPDISTLPADLSTWKAYDKLQRTLQILKNDHDAA